MGLSHYSVEDWVPLIPRLGKQTIDDVEAIRQKGGQVALSGESRFLKLVDKMLDVHNEQTAYPDNWTHSEYHALVNAYLGNKVCNAVQRMVQLARTAFQRKWSKDLWILVDFDLAHIAMAELGINPNMAGKSPIEATTEKFAWVLQDLYIPGNHISDCDADIKELLALKCILHGPDNLPNQILLCFIIDLVMNPDEWQKWHISNDERFYFGILPNVIKMAKYLHQQDLFKENHKENILKLDTFIRSQGDITANNWMTPTSIPDAILQKLYQVEEEQDQFVFRQKNKRLLFGFYKKLPNETVPAQGSVQNYQCIEEVPLEVARKVNLREPNLLLNPHLLRKAFVVACQDHRSEDVTYFVKHLNRYLDNDSLGEGMHYLMTAESVDSQLLEVIWQHSGDAKWPRDEKGNISFKCMTSAFEVAAESKELKRKNADLQAKLNEKETQLLHLTSQLELQKESRKKLRRSV